MGTPTWLDSSDSNSRAARTRRRRTVAGLVGLGLVVALLGACADATLIPGGTAPASGNPSPLVSTLGATASPASIAAATSTSDSALPAKSATPDVPASNPAGTPIAALGATVTIVAAGDIACDPAHNVGTPKDCDQAATADLIGQLNPTAVLALGDIQYENGTPAAYQAVFAPTWGKYRSIMYPAIGNHEYLTKGAAGYFGYFGVPAYYSFDLGSWHLISLDSECSFVGGCQPGSAQEVWLKADLAAHPARCTLAYWHEPRWSSGEHQDATQMTTIWADLVAAHVSVVLTGHNHDYERFVPLDANGKPDPSGPTEFVVGTGGKNHYGFAVPALTGEVVRNDTSFGVIDMTLAPTAFSWHFVDAPGYNFHDAGTADCVG